MLCRVWGWGRVGLRAWAPLRFARGARVYRVWGVFNGLGFGGGGGWMRLGFRVWGRVGFGVLGVFRV